MITGFNTDVEHGGIVYHVQTEDKGLESPIILSLVYTGGTILASKRSPYEDLIASGYSDEALAERLKRQHRLICAAIHSGRIDDLKKMTRREPGETGPPRSTAPLTAPEESADSPQVDASLDVETTAEAAPAFKDSEADPIEFGEIELDEPAQVPTTISIDSDIVLGIDEQQEMIWELLSKKQETEERAKAKQAELEAATPEPASHEASLVDESHPDMDQQELVAAEPSEPGDGVVIKLLDEEEFFSGELRNLRVFVTERHGDKEKALVNFPVSIKILGTGFRPLIYSVKTERDGVASVQTEIPQFTAGRAAVLIRVVGKENTAELRRVIHPTSR